MCEHLGMKNALEKYREESGMTLSEIAFAAGFRSRSSVFQHCRGSRTISAESALKYSRALGIPLSELRPDLWPPTASPTTPPAECEGSQAARPVP